MVKLRQFLGRHRFGSSCHNDANTIPTCNTLLVTKFVIADAGQKIGDNYLQAGINPENADIDRYDLVAGLHASLSEASRCRFSITRAVGQLRIWLSAVPSPSIIGSMPPLSVSE